ncbi:MAG: sensor domain-containing diguanylate cyclase, partial [Thermodesulfovibrionales bacterium]
QDQGLFLKYLVKHKPVGIIAEDSFLSYISDKTTRFPVIAVITGKIEKGLDTAITHNVNCYIYSPYLEKDLAYKLERIIMERNEFDSMKHEIWELGICAELSQLISTTLDPKELLYKIVRKIADVMAVNRSSIIRVDWLRKSAIVVASHEDPNMPGIRLNLKKYPEILAALASKEPILINDISTDPLMKKVREIIMPLGIRSILVIPIIFHEKVIGTLFLRTSKTERTFSASEIQLLNTIAKTSANALYNAFLFEQVEDEKARLEKLAVTDFLTGIYNIRYFYQRIIEEFNRSERYIIPISCLMLDIDHFKSINDAYGHKIGDTVLQEFSKLLRRFIRKVDVLARYGGEEFIILLPQTSMNGALAEAERIRTSIKKHKFKSLKNKGGLTVSIGISYFPHPEVQTHDDLISFADDALYKAKNSGRDKVIIYE